MLHLRERCGDGGDRSKGDKNDGVELSCILIETRGIANEFDLGGENDYNKEYLLGFWLSNVDDATNLLKWRK